MTYTKAGGNYGADLVIERDGVRTVVQCKQRKENISNDAVEAVHSSRYVYHASNALIICTSEFTKPALNLADIHKGDCWNDTRLLQEIHKWQYF